MVKCTGKELRLIYVCANFSHVHMVNIDVPAGVDTTPFLSSLPSLVLSPSLSFIFTSLYHSEQDYSVEFDYFLRGKESLRMDIRVPDMAGLTKEQVQR